MGINRREQKEISRNQRLGTEIDREGHSAGESVETLAGAEWEAEGGWNWEELTGKGSEKLSGESRGAAGINLGHEKRKIIQEQDFGGDETSIRTGEESKRWAEPETETQGKVTYPAQRIHARLPIKHRIRQVPD